MESIHVVFDDKKIQGLSDEGFHDNLRFENEGEGDLYDSDDDCDDTIQNVGINPGTNVPTDDSLVQQTTVIGNSTEASVETTLEGSVETPQGSSVERMSQSFNQSRNNACLLYTSPSPRDATLSRMPSSA